MAVDHRATPVPGDARPVSSNQPGLHPRLAETVRRHRQKPFQKTIAGHNRRAFDTLQHWLDPARALILDTFCGVGESTVHLARRFPDAQVVGIDKSAVRLARHDNHYRRSGVDNYRLLRADAEDIWRLAAGAGLRPRAHFLLYPNPWPKSAHLKRRVHGSPVFPVLLALGGRVELRSNWRLYVEEFAAAVQLFGCRARPEAFRAEPPITPFERKYQAAGQALWRCISDLSEATDTDTP